MNPRAIPIPANLAHLPLDPRGYPIFEMIVKDATGKPIFSANDENVRQDILARDVCGLCGKPLFRARWLVGGPMSAFNEHGAYLDPPMHAECLHYAMQVCPYLAAPNWKVGGIAQAQIKAADFGPHGRAFREDAQSDDTRPPLFVAVQYVDQTYVRGDLLGETVSDHASKRAGIEGLDIVRYIKPKPPFRQVEYWRQGRQLPELEGAHLALQHVVASGEPLSAWARLYFGKLRTKALA